MISVVVCSDEPVLFKGLSRILEQTQKLDLVGYCPTIEQIRVQLGVVQPDILLIDLNSGFNMNHLKVLQESPSQAKIVLWVHSISTELALQAMRTGVRGILR